MKRKMYVLRTWMYDDKEPFETRTNAYEYMKRYSFDKVSWR